MTYAGNNKLVFGAGTRLFIQSSEYFRLQFALIYCLMTVISDVFWWSTDALILVSKTRHVGLMEFMRVRLPAVI